MTTGLTLVAQGSGEQVGWMQLDAQRVSFSDDTAERIFRSLQRLGEWSDEGTFERLATGWSNGYLTIRATADPLQPE